MNATIDDTQVRAYLEALKPHLVDLPEDERGDLLEDLEQHLREVAAEGDGTLEERLGSPAAYAAELRASVGFPPSEPTPLARRIADRLAHSSLARGVESAASAKPVRAVREFLPELRPGWWVLRGYLLVAGPAIVLRPYPQLSSDFPIPFLGSHIAGLGAVAIAIWASRKSIPSVMLVASTVAGPAVLGPGYPECLPAGARDRSRRHAAAPKSVNP